MTDGPESIIYAEAVRAITRQQAVIEGLRSRSGTLFSAASLVTAFLGGQALASEPKFDFFVWLAVVAFVALFGLVLAIMWPWKFRFVVSARVMIEDHMDKDAPGLQRYLAEIWDDNYDLNQSKVDLLHWVFRCACLSLSVEVVAWLISLRGR